MHACSCGRCEYCMLLYKFLMDMLAEVTTQDSAQALARLANKLYYNRVGREHLLSILADFRVV